MKMSRDDFIKVIEACGQSIIDNAEKIYNTFEFSTAGVQIMVDISAREVPEITVIKKFLPENFMKRIGVKS